MATGSLNSEGDENTVMGIPKKHETDQTRKIIAQYIHQPFESSGTYRGFPALLSHGIQSLFFTSDFVSHVQGI